MNWRRRLAPVRGNVKARSGKKPDVAGPFTLRD